MHANHAAFLSQDIPVHWFTVYSSIHVNCNSCYDSSWFQVKLQRATGCNSWNEGPAFFHSFWQNCLPKLRLFLSSPRIPSCASAGGLSRWRSVYFDMLPLGGMKIAENFALANFVSLFGNNAPFPNSPAAPGAVHSQPGTGCNVSTWPGPFP